MRYQSRVCTMKQMIKIIIVTLIMVITGCGNGNDEVTLSNYSGLESIHTNDILLEGENDKKDLVEDTEDILISVYICGAVNNPGVYEFSIDERVTHAIERAGGFASNADMQFINLAQLLKDGEKIYIPTEVEVQEGYNLGFSSQASGVDSSGKININTATKEQLMTLTGVGEAKALSIISYRDTNGSFSAIEDVMKISGIKDAVFNTIKDYITV